MCGIFGIIGKQQSIEASTNSIMHRGPDSSGFYNDDFVSLGFRRLSIIDLSSDGNQPMVNEDDSIYLVFNGEIYGYESLRVELEANHKFKSKTDTEILLHGYEEWGLDELLNKINGMYAFALYDKKKSKIYLVRDRIGKKPLYYYSHKDYISFSSETKAFFHLNDFNFDIDSKMFERFLGFSFLADNGRTVIQNVSKVPPGSYLEIDSNLEINITEYWDINNSYKKPENTSGNRVNDLENLLIESVETRLIADVPVGVLLSGGLDSSLITALASKNRKDPIKTINISFKDSHIDESNYADIVAKHCGTDHTSLKLTVEDAYEDFKKNIWLYDSLDTVDGGLYSTYLMSKAIREMGVKVVLVGEGADEIFGGYSWFQLSLFPFNLVPGIIKSFLYYYAIMRSFQKFKYPMLLHRLLSKCNAKDYFKKVQYFEITQSLPNHYCMKVDKGTLGGSIEARAPFMDYRVVEFAAKLKKSDFLASKIVNLRSSIEKDILRKIAVKYLPKEIFTRKKRGGMLPTNDILNIGLKKDFDLILNNKFLVNVYGQSYLKRLIEKPNGHILYKWKREWILWKCLVFALWYDYYAQINK